MDSHLRIQQGKKEKKKNDLAPQTPTTHNNVHVP